MSQPAQHGTGRDGLRLLQGNLSVFRRQGFSDSPRRVRHFFSPHALAVNGRSCTKTRFSDEVLLRRKPRGPFPSPVRELVRRRFEGSRLAYSLGSKEFFLLPYECHRPCLVPRCPDPSRWCRLPRNWARNAGRPARLDVGLGRMQRDHSVANCPPWPVLAVDPQSAKRWRSPAHRKRAERQLVSPGPR